MRQPVRSAENTVHDLIAVSNDLRRHVDDHLSRRGYADLRPGFAPLLSKLWAEGVPQGRLADAMGVSPQAASHTVRLAERAGYVTRESNPGDRRSKQVVLNDLGRELVRDGAVAITARASEYAHFLGARRYARFDRSVSRLRAGLGIADDATPVTHTEPRASVIAVSLLADHAMRELREALRAAHHDGISGTQNLVLVHIGPDGARSSELARAQRITRQAVSNTLHELEALGYVARRHDARDARSVVFVPTRQGRRVLDAYVAGIDALERRYADVLGADRYVELAEAAHDLSQRVRLERTFSAPAAGGGSRRARELADVAAELWQWLGEADALRLAELIGLLAVDHRRSARREVDDRQHAGARP